MSEGKDPEDWKAVLSVFKAFKIIALNRKIPIITTTQLTDKGNIAYATSLKQYCDGMWAMLQDEVQRNQGGVIANRYPRLEARREACEKINEMFGTNISVDYREDYQTYDLEKITDDNEKEVNE